MTNKKIFIATALVAILFFQLNHLAVMNVFNSHDASSQCATEQAASSEKCLCCALEQADKNQQVFSHQNFNLTPALPQNTELTSSNSRSTDSPKYPKENRPKRSKWLRTIVQNK